MTKIKTEGAISELAVSPPDLDTSNTQLLRMDEILDLVRSFSRLREPFGSRLLAGDLAQHLARINQMLPASEQKRGAAPNGIVRVGLVLSRLKEPITMGELAKETDLPLSSSTHIMDRLVESGYAERFTEPDDRRIVRVALTKSGIELYESLFVTIQQRFSQILSQFTQHERAELRQLLHKFTEALEKASE
jgi:DNA-binding MarR family transcriptional regulator